MSPATLLGRPAMVGSASALRKRSVVSAAVVLALLVVRPTAAETMTTPATVASTSQAGDQGCASGEYLSAAGVCEACPDADSQGYNPWGGNSAEEASGCTSCPFGMSPAGGTGCRFSPLPMLVWLILDLAGAFVLAALLDAARSDAGCDTELAYCSWFVFMLPVHIALRLVLLLHTSTRALLRSCARCRRRCRCGQVDDEPPREHVDDRSTKARRLELAALAIGVLVESFAFAVYSGMLAPSGHPLFWVLFAFGLWAIFCAANPAISPIFGLYGKGPTSSSLCRTMPWSFRNKQRLLFLHYAVGLHPKVEDFQYARHKKMRDMPIGRLMYELALPWMTKELALQELRVTMREMLVKTWSANPYVTETGEMGDAFKYRLSPLKKLLDGAGLELEWRRDWRPALLSAGEDMIESLVWLGLCPANRDAIAALRDVAGDDEEDTLMVDDIAPFLRHACTSPEKFDELSFLVSWDAVWAPPCLRGDADFIRLLVSHGLHPSAQVLQDAYRACILRDESDPPVPFNGFEALLSAAAPDSRPLKIFHPLAWEDGWRTLAMDNRSLLIGLLVMRGAYVSREVLEAGIREIIAPWEALEPLLRAVEPSGRVNGLSERLSWGEFWEPLLKGGHAYRVQILSAHGIAPTIAAVEAAIRAHTPLMSLSPLLRAYEAVRAGPPSGSGVDSTATPTPPMSPPLSSIGPRLSWAEIWRPAIDAADGGLSVDLLASHGISPTLAVAEAAIRARLSIDQLTRILTAHMRGATSSAGLATLVPILSWEDVWREPVLRADVAWLRLLCRFGVPPSDAVAEAALREHAPLASLELILDAAEASPSTASPADGEPSPARRPLRFGAHTWSRIAAREGADAVKATAAAVRASVGSGGGAPPRAAVIEAFSEFRDPEVVKLLAGTVEHDQLELPRELWLDFISTMAPGSATDRCSRSSSSAERENGKKGFSNVPSDARSSTVAGESSARPGGAPPAAQAARAEALLLVALQRCAAPPPPVAREMWALAVDTRSARVARILREQGILVAARDSADEDDRDGEVPERMQELYSRLADGTAVMVRVPRPLADPGEQATDDALGRGDDATVEAVATAALAVAAHSSGGAAAGAVRTGGRSAPLSPGELLASAVGVGGDRRERRADGREELLRELVQLPDVRAHLDRTAQADRDLSLQPSQGPEGLSEAARMDRARSLREVAARMMGRAALRAQGLRPRSVRMPPAKSVPAVRDLEGGEASKSDETVSIVPTRRDGLCGGLSAYDGVWVNARTNQTVCEIVNGVLMWSERYEEPEGGIHGGIHVGPHGELVMELEGATYAGELDEDDAEVLLWSDGDVWKRSPLNPAPREASSKEVDGATPAMDSGTAPSESARAATDSERG